MTFEDHIAASPRRSIRRVSLPYVWALLYVGAALLLMWLIEPRVGQSLSPLLYAAVMLAAWAGGLGPALLATAISAYFSAFPFTRFPESPGFGWDDSARVVVFLLVAILMSSLTSLRKRAEQALQRSHAQLELRVEQRTAELRRSNDLLRESEERFRLLVDGVADYAIVMLDAAGKIVSWNPGAGRIFGYAHEQAVGRDASAFYRPQDIAQAKPAADLREAAEQGRHEDEGWRVRRDSSHFWANVITTALRDEQGRLRGFAQVTRDVTELRSLEKELLEISEREQMRIGHDLHDGLGQELTGIALLAQNLRQKLSQQHPGESAEAARIASLVNRAVEQTRKLARGFSPVDLGPEGLETALRDIASKVQALGRPCTAVFRGQLSATDDAAALHLFRIAQEAVNNALRHANAKQIRVELDTMPSAVTLAVHDDGVGLPQPDLRGKGMGIRVMQYRARMIGATLEIRSGSSGTSVICTCPTQATHEHDTDQKASDAGASRASGGTGDSRNQDPLPRASGG
ncbi:MAG: PAS domain S-box protein [Tepidisphaeraceae bacterium]